MFWLGLAVSLCYIPGITGAYIATQWPVLAVALPFALLREGPFTAWHGVGLAFLVYAALRVFYSPVPDASVFGMWLVVIAALSVWFGTTLTSTRELYAGLATGAAVSSAVAVFQYFGFHPVETAPTAPAGIYFNSVQQGLVLALIAVALLSERMWLWTLPLVPGIALSQSRGAWLALLVGLLGCGVRRLWVFGIVAVAGAVYLLTPLTVSDEHRLFIWRSTWDNLTWFGWGPGVFYAIVLPLDKTNSFFPEYAHNDALQLFFEFGVAGILPLSVFGYALWRTDVKEWPVVLAFIAAGCYSMPLFMPVASFLGLAAVGRVLREHGMVRSHRNSCRQHVVPREWSCARTGREAVPLAPHLATEG